MDVTRGLVGPTSVGASTSTNDWKSSIRHTGATIPEHGWPAMRHEYEFRYHYGVSPHPAIERADMTDDSQAAVRALRELLCMPSRHAVEVWREGVVIFWRSRIRP